MPQIFYQLLGNFKNFWRVTPSSTTVSQCPVLGASGHCRRTRAGVRVPSESCAQTEPVCSFSKWGNNASVSLGIDVRFMQMDVSPPLHFLLSSQASGVYLCSDN